MCYYFNYINNKIGLIMSLISNSYKSIAPYGLSLPSTKAVLLLAGSLLIIQALAMAAFNRLTSSPEIRQSDFRREQTPPHETVVTEETGAQLDKIKAVKALYTLAAVGSAVIPICINPAYAAFYITSLMLFARFIAGPTQDNLSKKLPLSAGDMTLTDPNAPIADTGRFNTAGQPAAVQLPLMQQVAGPMLAFLDNYLRGG